MATKGPVGPSVYPQYVKGPQGNLIGVRGPVQMWPSPTTPPPTGIIVSPPTPVRYPPIVYPPDKPPVHGGPRPPIRVTPYPTPAPPIYYPGTGRPKRKRHHHRHDYRYGPRRHPAPYSPVHHPVIVKSPPQLTPAPIHVPVAPVLPTPTGKICPSWGWMVKTNEDGSETVVKCQPGLPGAPGLHGLEGITDTIQGALGPNWMLYIGVGLAAWYFMKKH